MEEVSSFWSLKLGWMTFFCCMMATMTADLFNSSFHEFHFDGMFGLFKTDKYIIFKASLQTLSTPVSQHIKRLICNYASQPYIKGSKFRAKRSLISGL